MPRFHSFYDMPVARGIYCYAPCMAATRERKVPILGLESQPSSVSACPALTQWMCRPRQLCALLAAPGRALRAPQVSRQLSHALPPRLGPFSVTPGVAPAVRHGLAVYCHTKDTSCCPGK